MAGSYGLKWIVCRILKRKLNYDISPPNWNSPSGHSDGKSMSRCFSILPGCLLSLVLICFTPLTCPAESGRSTAMPPRTITAETRPAQALFEEADTYITKKYEEFNRRNI